MTLERSAIRWGHGLAGIGLKAEQSLEGWPGSGFRRKDTEITFVRDRGSALHIGVNVLIHYDKRSVETLGSMDLNEANLVTLLEYLRYGTRP